MTGNHLELGLWRTKVAGQFRRPKLSPHHLMAKIFIGSSLVLTLLTATLSIMAKGHIEKMKIAWGETKVNLAKGEASLQTAKNDLKKATEDLTLANESAKQSAQALETKTAELTTKIQELTNAQNQVATQATEIEALKVKIASMDPPKGPTPTTPTASMEELLDKLQKAQVELTEKEALVQTMMNNLRVAESRLSSLEQTERRRQEGISLPGLQGRILAVNAGWNFVVLNIGDKQGLAVNSALLVVRGKSPIARLRITSVEPATSIADLIPNSVARGVTVQPGDTVIVEGRTPSSETKAEAEVIPGFPRST